MVQNSHRSILVRPFLIFLCVTLCVSFILGCNSEKKQIFAPQFHLPILGEIFSLDLNEDGLEDFIFEYSVYSTDDEPRSAAANFLSVRPLDDNRVQCSADLGCQPLPDSAVIDDSLNWSSYSGWLAHISWSISSGWQLPWTGTWTDVSEMSLGLEIHIGDSNHFGWVKLSVNSELGTLIVYDYAYQPISGEPILAGVHPSY